MLLNYVLANKGTKFKAILFGRKVLNYIIRNFIQQSGGVVFLPAVFDGWKICVFISGMAANKLNTIRQLHIRT
ncbi:MAG: hypothetical protein IPG29_05120 [Sphingobacteriales bacterium]|nr:hypothetical protein [Sphingobacteriales bacterium]